MLYKLTPEFNILGIEDPHAALLAAPESTIAPLTGGGPKWKSCNGSGS